jgi:tRNA A22 N-methylase
MSSEYHLPDLLRNGGFNVIKEKIIIDESKTYRLLHGKHISYVDRLENVLNTYSLQEYFNKKLQS